VGRGGLREEGKDEGGRLENNVEETTGGNVHATVGGSTSACLRMLRGRSVSGRFGAGGKFSLTEDEARWVF